MNNCIGKIRGSGETYSVKFPIYVRSQEVQGDCDAKRASSCVVLYVQPISEKSNTEIQFINGISFYLG